jgi:pimeloyl-ACP methyl ester carboxylesterase
VLFLYGAMSPVTGPDAAARAAAANPAAAVAVVDGAGHMLPFDALDRFLDAVRDFAGRVTGQHLG